MQIKSFHDIDGISVTTEGAAHVTMHLAIGPDHGANHFTMRVFEIAPGGHTPRHHHDFEHEIFVHAGRAEVFVADTTYPLAAGHIAFIPPNVEHQFRNVGDTPFVFVCVIPNAE